MFPQDKRGPRGPERKAKTGQDETRIKTGKTDEERIKTGKTDKEIETGKTEGKTKGFKDHWDILHLTGTLNNTTDKSVSL